MPCLSPEGRSTQVALQPMVAGQSMGEILAAYAGGALTLQDAAWLVCFRSQLLKKITDRGGMLMVALSVEECRELITGKDWGDSVSIGISSSPLSTVLSGDS